MTYRARAFNPTINPRRKGISRVPLPPHHERATPLIPGRREDASNAVIVPRNPALEIEAPRPREPSVSAFDRLWGSIIGLSLAWFEREEQSYLILWYELNRKFVEFHPAKQQFFSIRIERPDDKVVLAADSGLTWADEYTLYVRTDFSARAVEWLTTNRESVLVHLTRQTPAPTAMGKRPRREIGFVPKRARHVPRFC